ncbi:conserved hypothetical protein [uncultured Defluviicoccus sp.]|uniref:Uncharacterized protein n=1 Tax=metagenome TaxID=256318 RepID=A0A380TBT2_9ZZZZ|nr:conserved hypothetical protein [uncultured Defluviicoccus sp.]
MSPRVDITVDLLAGPDHAVSFELCCEHFELNVSVPHGQLKQLELAPTREWQAGSVRAGTCAGASVFWAAGQPGYIAIMVGHDDEIWGFSVSIPIIAFTAALSQAKSLVRVSSET